MTPLLGTKNPSAPVGDKSGGDGRAARSRLSCALWRSMGRLWRGMGGMGRPEPLPAHHPRQQQGLSGFHEPRVTKHESRPLCFPTHYFPRFPGISRHFPAPDQMPGLRPPFSLSLTTNAVRRSSRRPVAAFLRVVARHGAAMARHGRHGPPRAAVRAPSAPATGPFGLSRNTRPETRLLPGARRGVPSGPARIPRFSRNTNHETRITAFFEECFGLRCQASACGPVLDQRYNLNLASLHFSPRGEAKCLRGPSGRGASRLARAGVLEQYVEHGKQAQRSPGARIACFDCRVVRNAG